MIIIKALGMGILYGLLFMKAWKTVYAEKKEEKKDGE